jgi:hypothetical protein
MALAQHQMVSKIEELSNGKINKCKQINVEDSRGSTAVPVAGQRGFASQSKHLHISKNCTPPHVADAFPAKHEFDAASRGRVDLNLFVGN